MEDKVTIGGKEYIKASLPENIQKLLAIYSKWEQETAEIRMDLAKNEAAIRDLSREIVDEITKYDVKMSEAVPAEA